MTESLQSCPNPWCGGVGPMPFALRDHKWAVICGCDFHGPTRDDREAAITAWNTRAPRSEGLAAPKGIDRSELVERELKRCHEVIGAYVIAQAYADTLPDDAEDAADMTFGQHYWEGAASHWAGEDLLSRAHEAAKARMRVENPVQVRDLDWSAAMSDVVASGGLPREGEDEDPVCTDCGGSGITYQTERPCACIPIALSAPMDRGAQYAQVALGNAREVSRLTGINWTLAGALERLTRACEAADNREELAEEIDGSLLDAANAALALQSTQEPQP